jgi:hypothetical protein
MTHRNTFIWGIGRTSVPLPVSLLPLLWQQQLTPAQDPQ